MTENDFAGKASGDGQMISLLSSAIDKKEERS